MCEHAKQAGPSLAGGSRRCCGGAAGRRRFILRGGGSSPCPGLGLPSSPTHCEDGNQPMCKTKTRAWTA
jgi:hypothetical protein